MKWILSLAITILVMLLLPFAIIAARKSTKGKGRLGGAVLAIGLAFGGLFDPGKDCRGGKYPEEEGGGRRRRCAGRASGMKPRLFGQDRVFASPIAWSTEVPRLRNHPSRATARR